MPTSFAVGPEPLSILQFAFHKANLKKLGGYYFAQQLKQLSGGFSKVLKLSIAGLDAIEKLSGIEFT